MKNLIVPFLLPFSMLFSSMTHPIEIEKTAKNEKVFTDLTSEEKKEAIAYMLTSNDCSWEGISLFGKVQIVDVFPDIKVQIVEVFPDIKVEWVDVFADDCGKWQKVDVFPDFKIQFVDVFPDLKIQEVDVFPGMN